MRPVLLLHYGCLALTWALVPINAIWGSPRVACVVLVAAILMTLIDVVDSIR